MSKAELINFQSHANTVIDLLPGINGIIAPSNVGKSSITRMIQWVLYNNIQGEPHYIKTGADFTIGRVHFSNGTTIEREVVAPEKDGKRRVKKNFYRVYQDGDLIHEITGFGINVPTVVQEAHNMMPTNPKMNLNFWNQLDKPFLVTDKPADRAEAMGNLDELKTVDSSLIELNSEVLSETKSRNAATSRVKQIQKEIEEIEAEIELDRSRAIVVKSMVELCQMAGSMSDQLDSFQKEVESMDHRLELNDAKIRDTQVIKDLPIDELSELIQTVRTLTIQGNELGTVKERQGSLKSIKKEHLDTLVEGIEIVSAQDATLRRLERLERERKELDERKATLPKTFDTSKLDIEDLNGLVGQVRTLMTLMDQLTRNAKAIEQQEERGKAALQRESQALEELLHALRDVQICPTCGQSTDNVDEHAAKHAIQS